MACSVTWVMLGGLLLVTGCGSAVTAPSPVLRDPIFRQGSLALTVSSEQGVGTRFADLDSGATPEFDTQNTADLWFYYVVAFDALFLQPQNGATQVEVGAAAPGRAGCAAATLSTSRIAVANLTAGTYLCVRTSENRLAQVRITSLPGPDPATLPIQFVVYQ